MEVAVGPTSSGLYPQRGRGLASGYPPLTPRAGACTDPLSHHASTSPHAADGDRAGLDGTAIELASSRDAGYPTPQSNSKPLHI